MHDGSSGKDNVISYSEYLRVQNQYRACAKAKEESELLLQVFEELTLNSEKIEDLASFLIGAYGKKSIKIAKKIKEEL
jgi:hypothetical protein